MEYRKEKIIFGIVTAVFWFSLYTYVPILSPYAQSLGATESVIGIIIGSYGFTQTIIRIPLGIASDKLNKRKLFIVLGTIVSVISALGPYIVRNSIILLIFRGLSGVAAATWVAFTVLFTSYFKEKDTPKALGIINSYNYFGQMMAMLLGGWVAQNYGQASTFLLSVVIGSIGVLLSFAIVENTNMNKKPLQMREILIIGKNKNLMLASSLAIISQIVTFSTAFGFTPMIAKNLGASSFELGLLSTLSTLPMILASSLSGTFFTEKLGVKVTIIVGFILGAFACITIPFSKSLLGLYITQMIGGFGRGITFPLLMSVSIRDIESNQRATAMGFFQAIYGVGMFLGPALVGVISEISGMEIAFIVIAFLSLVAAFMSRIIKENSSPRAL